MASGTLTPGFLSESTNGRGIKVATNVTPGTLIHTAVTGTADMDFVTLVANNTSGANVVLTIEWGGTTAPDDTIEIDLTKETAQQIVALDRRINNGLAIRAFAGTADVVVIYGHVDTLEI